MKEGFLSSSLKLLQLTDAFNAASSSCCRAQLEALSCATMAGLLEAVPPPPPQRVATCCSLTLSFERVGVRAEQSRSQQHEVQTN
jgi:hypothetical protein